MSAETKTGGRRRFFTSVLRWTAAAALAAVTAKLVWRNTRQGPLNPDEKCTNRGLCRGCPTLKNCAALPAELFRRGQEDA
jgi:hypothetical protein